MDGSTNTPLVRTENSATEILQRLDEQSAALRTLAEQIGKLIGLLTPAPKDGPSLDEVLAKLIEVLGSQVATTGRIEEMVAAQAHDLPLAVAAAVLRARAGEGTRA